MIKTILASLTGHAGDAPVLETAALAARQFGAHLDCVHVRLEPPTAATIAAWESHPGHARVVEQMQASIRRLAERATASRKAFDDLQAKAQMTVATAPPDRPGGATIEYREIPGIDLDETIREARFHDLCIAARDSRTVIYEPDRAGTIMLSSGQPILVPARKPLVTLGRTVVVAWKDTAESARAAAAALPFLELAEKTVVLTIEEDKTRAPDERSSADSLAAHLRWHGLKVERKDAALSAKPVSEILLDTAYALGGDLLVMGGYGHSRLREFVFGGVTRDILGQCEIPVLMAH